MYIVCFESLLENFFPTFLSFTGAQSVAMDLMTETTEDPRLDSPPNVNPFRLNNMDASRGITPVVILWVTSHKHIHK